MSSQAIGTERTHALYRMYDQAGQLLYVGITLDVATRFANHRGDKPWWTSVATIKLEHFADRASVLAAERRAIQQERPAYNVVHRWRPAPQRCDPRRPALSGAMNIRVPEALRKDAIAIAKIRQERDEEGFGLSVVVRHALEEYVARYEHLLEQADD